MLGGGSELRILVTGGAGFIGSHVAEFYARRGAEVTVFDNLSRAQLLGKGQEHVDYNWNYLRRYPNIKLVKGDVADLESLERECTDVEVIVHAAAQTAVTSSVANPLADFRSNALGTFNVLETARRAKGNLAVIYTSTNKVYGNNVNKIPVRKKKTRYAFEENFAMGVPESLSIDLCEHTPYGSSKLAGDLYVQDYAHVYGIRTGVFRMSCIYGTRQFGVEDQGWISWFIIATLTGRPITIYGDGKQVRDTLYVTDLVAAFDAFLRKRGSLAGEVFNMGGGPENTLSLLELLDLIKECTGKKITPSYADWRPADQKVYISDIRKAKEKLGWTPKVDPREGVRMLIAWAEANKDAFSGKSPPRRTRRT